LKPILAGFVFADEQLKKNISKITVLSLFAATLVAMPVLSRAEGTKASAASDQTVPAKPK
jgi:hypothetical protein